MKNIKVALIGTPNVGKSTIFNSLTNNHVHTGNWAGKTVSYTMGECAFNGNNYIIYDLPGTYSLISKSKEEMIATDFIIFNDFDVAVVVCDATSLEKGINLCLQTKEICKKVVVCINLMDEAKKKGIHIDTKRLEKNLNCKVVETSARENMGLQEVLKAVECAEENAYMDIDYGILNNSIDLVCNDIVQTKTNKKWVALRVLDQNKHYISEFQKLNTFNFTENTKKAQENLMNVDINLEIVIKVMKTVKATLKDVVHYEYNEYDKKDRKVDKVLTSKIWGIPIMLLLLFIIFYITIVGANYPSDLLFKLFNNLEKPLLNFLNFICLPSFLTDLLVNGVYKTLYWVVSVMMPPMLIFFPLFTFLEDLGILPRIAFNMDKSFQKCEACGKQALTMCMGIGCNAVGVTGARIIDSKRERLIAILTNVFMPCNGKFPTLIAVITMFFVGLNKTYGSILCAGILTGFIFLGILITFLISLILSKTILKGEPSSFTLELPPYRLPKIWDTLKYSVKNRAIFVLGRAIKVAIPAGVIIWCIANIKIGGTPLLNYLINFFNSFGLLLGLDGVIILALLLGFPANEIVIPIMLMCYLRTNTLIDYEGFGQLKSILIANGWTIKTAICFLIAMMYHYPCSTTILTIKKETGSIFYTLLSFIIPVIVGIIICIFLNLIL